MTDVQLARNRLGGARLANKYKDCPENRLRIEIAESALVYERLRAALAKAGQMTTDHVREYVSTAVDDSVDAAQEPSILWARMEYMRACRRGHSIHDRAEKQSRLNAIKARRAIAEALPQLLEEHAELVRAALRDGRPLTALPSVARL